MTNMLHELIAGISRAQRAHAIAEGQQPAFRPTLQRLSRDQSGRASRPRPMKSRPATTICTSCASGAFSSRTKSTHGCGRLACSISRNRPATAARILERSDVGHRRSVRREDHGDLRSHRHRRRARRLYRRHPRGAARPEDRHRRARAHGRHLLNWGCIPTKALLRSAEVYRHMRHAKDYGLTAGKHSASTSTPSSSARAGSPRR